LVIRIYTSRRGLIEGFSPLLYRMRDRYPELEIPDVRGELSGVGGIMGEIIGGAGNGMVRYASRRPVVVEREEDHPLNRLLEAYCGEGTGGHEIHRAGRHPFQDIVATPRAGGEDTVPRDRR
jgi:hypothetical protein